ncbi:peptidoglycan-binding domain-containing protein [Qaidamihabitans albus]|uniref:peptidoglycan-binding domain-containing protein n=1 Tax=Qaidamihabitans albus TaxID=2795733 RepID=UPI001F243FAC|nr:peptidoglycan-binding domain-containing protein [Qaidamihabitans albus]
MSVAAVLMAVTGTFVSTGSATAATPLCVKVVLHSPGGGHAISVPAASGNSTSCLIGRGLVANTAIVVQFQYTMIRCYGSRYLAAPYQNERIRDLATDGSFGPRTEAALKSVQKAVGTTADGTYGPNTRDRMRFVSRDGRDCHPYRS